MSIKNYIIDKLNNLIIDFPMISIKYAINKFNGSHIVEVLPKKIYDSDEEYSRHEAEFIFDIISNFPEEEIVFVTENSIFDFDELLYEKKGEKYYDCQMKNFIDINDLDIYDEINIDEQLFADTFSETIESPDLEKYHYLPESLEQESIKINQDYYFAEAA